ncbi:hypothetical protein HZS_251 [Henneguya salminicola]|nr:hypothetical protein HZS_251 [Henneguya salminicola]
MNPQSHLNELKAIIRRLNVMEIKLILMAFNININDHWSRQQAVSKIYELINHSDMFISSTAISLIYKSYYNKVGLSSAHGSISNLTF